LELEKLINSEMIYALEYVRGFLLW